MKTQVHATNIRLYLAAIVVWAHLPSQDERAEQPLQRFLKPIFRILKESHCLLRGEWEWFLLPSQATAVLGCLSRNGGMSE